MILKKLFNKKIKESDNVGTQVLSSVDAQGYWSAYLMENPILKAKTSYYFYVFPNEIDAISALEELSFIFRATDSNNLISMKILHYGVYLNEKNQWEAMIMGKNLSEEIKIEIERSFKKMGGKEIK